MRVTQPEIYRLDDLVLDVEAMTLYRGETQIQVTGLSFDLLLMLVREAPKVVSHETLLEQIWQGAFVGEETLKQRVRLLRKSLGDDSKHPSYIETVRGKGYKLACPVTQESRTSGSSLPRPEKKRFYLTTWVAIASALVIIWFFVWQTQRTSTVASSTHQALNENLAAEELFQRAYIYYKRYMPGDNANAINLLQEAIHKDPEFAKAYALLSKAYSQQPKLGNGRFDQEAIAAAHQAITFGPEDPEGYDALGLHHDVNSRPQKALAAYEKALGKDPEHPAALSNAAYSLMLLGELDRALVLNTKGLRIHPQTQYGNVQMGDNLRLLELDLKAESWLQKAVTLQPDNVLANVSLAKLLLLQTRYSEALETLEKSATSPWGQGLIHSTKGDIYLFQGEYTLAESHYSQSEKAGDFYASYRLSILGALLGRENANQAFSDIEKQVLYSIEKGNRYASMNLILAAIKAWEGETTQALEWLDKALASGWTDLRWLALDPGLKALRDLPGFESRGTALRSRLSVMQNRVIDQNLIP